MLNSIGTSETGVHQKTLNRLVRFFDQFKQINFANDREMESQLETVRKELLNGSAVQYRGQHRNLKLTGPRAVQAPGSLARTPHDRFRCSRPKLRRHGAQEIQLGGVGRNRRQKFSCPGIKGSLGILLGCPRQYADGALVQRARSTAGEYHLRT